MDISDEALKAMLQRAGFVNGVGPYSAMGGLESFRRLLQEAGAKAWLPIETAPRDGTTIDVWAEGERVSNVWWGDPQRCWTKDAEPTRGWCVQEAHWDEFHDHEVDPAPTHWMPLPSPP
jgi:hypothetical protein